MPGSGLAFSQSPTSLAINDAGDFAFKAGQKLDEAQLRKLDENGVSFQSHVDGTQYLLTPERSMEIQALLAPIERLTEGVKAVAAGEGDVAVSNTYYFGRLNNSSKPEEPWPFKDVFANVNNNMTIAREEIFGPVMGIIRFKTEAEAVQLANNSSYGLQASVWSDNINRAHRVARALRAGTVHVNQYDEDDITVPFGGYKQSGNGRDKSLHAFDKYTELKTTWLRIDAA